MYGLMRWSAAELQPAGGMETGYSVPFIKNPEQIGVSK
jgi:hypothetical protein